MLTYTNHVIVFVIFKYFFLTNILVSLCSLSLETVKYYTVLAMLETWLTIFPLWEENKAIKITSCIKNKMHRVKQCPCLKASLHSAFVWCFGCLRRHPLIDSHCQCSYTDNRATALREDQGNTNSDCPFCRPLSSKVLAVLSLHQSLH